MVWDKSDVVHMDDAMAVPATGGFYKSVAHHFYEVCTCIHSDCTNAALQHSYQDKPEPLLCNIAACGI